MAIIAKYMGVCYEWVVPNDGLYGYMLPNGTWTGMLGLVNRSEADMAGIISITSRYKQAVDVSEPLYMDEFSVMHKRPVLQSDILGFYKPFTQTMWLTLLLCVLLTTAVTAAILHWESLLTRPRRKDGGRQRSGLLSACTKSVHWNFSHLLSQAVWWEPTGNPGRVISGLWLIAALILTTVYRSNLKAMLIMPRIVLPFDSLKELSESSIIMYVTKGNYFHDYVTKAPSDSVVGSLRKQVDAHEDIPRAIADILGGRRAGAGPMANIAVVMHEVFSKTGSCPLYVMSETFMKSTSRSIAIRKGAEFKPKVDRAIRGLKEFGILNHLLEKALVNATECLKPVTFNLGSESLRSLDLGDFYGVFAIYAGGVLLGCIAFVLEICASLVRKKQERLEA
ncbi:glutamate receptor ionotropic, delta-1-like [Penaeus monodon]|uniref:glutamate receptor ionotropic, delta-1-like n=1 Tax=Penaeus monodon TaxID=6687 RepID=UPI0018A7920F|nr:glutamate receptor ionotropic, delta-1-like [Penaeus monodon]